MTTYTTEPSLSPLTGGQESGSPLAAPSNGLLATAFRRLRRNPVAVAAAILLTAIMLACLAAPLYASKVAHTSPNHNGLTDTIVRGGRTVPVVSEAGVPVGPALSGAYLLGADSLGRDVMVRLLYGGRTSLLVGVSSALLTMLIAVPLGLAAGYLGGWPDRIVAAVFDVLWSFPVLLLGIGLGTALALGGLNVGPIHVPSGSLLIPILIIAAIFVPYLGRPVRGQVLSLREKEYVAAARVQGKGAVRIMFGEIFPNLTSTVLVFGTLIVANNILIESALSFLGVGVQPPAASWGNLVADGMTRLVTAPHLALVPGLAIALTVLALNLLGDALRDALDPRARIRLS